MTDRHTTNTTPALTPERETEIRARLGAAWRGPWAVQGCPGAAFLEIGTPNGPIAQVSVHLKHDAEFIADARQAVPELLAELDQVRAERDEALARVAELERPEIEAKRNEIRSSYSELIAQAQQAGDHEGAFEVQCRLRDREAQWKTEHAGPSTTA